MNIELNKKEYQALVDMVEIANWIMNAYSLEASPKIKAHDALRQKILAFAEEAGMGELMNHDKQTNIYQPNEAFVEKSDFLTFLEAYENEAFWEELISRLSLRDLIEKRGEEAVYGMPVEERQKAEAPFEDKYEKEFSVYGVNNLRIGKAK